MHERRLNAGVGHCLLHTGGDLADVGFRDVTLGVVPGPVEQS